MTAKQLFGILEVNVAFTFSRLSTLASKLLVTGAIAAAVKTRRGNLRLPEKIVIRNGKLSLIRKLLQMCTTRRSGAQMKLPSQLQGARKHSLITNATPASSTTGGRANSGTIRLISAQYTFGTQMVPGLRQLVVFEDIHRQSGLFHGVFAPTISHPAPKTKISFRKTPLPVGN
jgi:hypothetical protein